MQHRGQGWHAGDRERGKPCHCHGRTPPAQAMARHQVDGGRQHRQRGWGVGIGLGGFYRAHKRKPPFWANDATHHAPFGAFLLHRAGQVGVCEPDVWIMRAANRGIMTEGMPPHPFRHLPDSCPFPPKQTRAGRAIYEDHPCRVGDCSLHCSDRRLAGFAGTGKSSPP